MAVGNYWGTTDIQEIEDHITHKNDDPNLGLVNYIPFLEDDNVSESDTTDFEVWPNPVSDGSFTLTLENAIPSELVIYNVNGQRNELIIKPILLMLSLWGAGFIL